MYEGTFMCGYIQNPEEHKSRSTTEAINSVTDNVFKKNLCIHANKEASAKTKEESTENTDFIKREFISMKKYVFTIFAGHVWHNIYIHLQLLKHSM